jgi:hypothetical protein
MACGVCVYSGVELRDDLVPCSAREGQSRGGGRAQGRGLARGSLSLSVCSVLLVLSNQPRPCTSEPRALLWPTRWGSSLAWEGKALSQCVETMLECWQPWRQTHQSMLGCCRRRRGQAQHPSTPARCVYWSPHALWSHSWLALTSWKDVLGDGPTSICPRVRARTTTTS